MEALLIQLLGNTPTLLAVLIIYGRFDRRCSVMESEIKNIKEERKECLRRYFKN